MLQVTKESECWVRYDEVRGNVRTNPAPIRLTLATGDDDSLGRLELERVNAATWSLPQVDLFILSPLLHIVH